MITPNFYMHDSDRLALQALKAIPGFTQLFKAFMRIWDEKQFRIVNMSSNLRINEKQLPKYYDMLLPICKKLNMNVPELYLELNVVPNAYTVGDTKPFIVITSGLLETMPEELIQTVLAHECGHIACHHCLYTTMGQFILDTTSEFLNIFLGLGNLVIQPIQIAFFYWMRCSEFSADRVAAMYDGNANKVVEMCMRLAGYDKDINAKANVNEFMTQAMEYREMVNDSKWNKTLEFLLFNKRTHPLNTVRAYECAEWAKTERFDKITSFLKDVNEHKGSDIGAYLREIPMAESSKYYVGKNVTDVSSIFRDFGFTNINVAKTTQKGLMVKNGQVLNIRINGKDGFDMCDWYDIDSEIFIDFYEPETNEEITAAHPGQLRVTDSSKHYLGRVYQEVLSELQEAGFSNVVLEEQKKEKRGWLSKEGGIAKISINGQTQFDKGEWFEKKAIIRITYYTFAARASENN